VPTKKAKPTNFEQTANTYSQLRKSCHPENNFKYSLESIDPAEKILTETKNKFTQLALKFRLKTP